MRNSELNDSVCGAKKGPKLPEKGPNKPKLTCTILKDAAQTFSLKPFPEAASNRFNDFLQGLTNGRGERIRITCLHHADQRVRIQASLKGATWGPQAAPHANYASRFEGVRS